MILSIIVPIRNEMEYISRTFFSISEATADIQCEIFFVDGDSDDGTYEWLEEEIKKKKNYYLILNKRRIVSSGFNLVFPMTIGKFIARLDGHTIYPKDYFTKSLNILSADESDIVGGPALHMGKTWRGKTIAKCMMHPFGVGGSNFRSSNKKKFTDTVPFAVYKREIFDKAGLYDEALVKNQDDEHNYRCRSFGFRILMDPALQTEYYVRETLSSLWNQFFEYGIYKPLVFKKVPRGMRLRHNIPVLFILCLPILIYYGFKDLFFFIPIFLYFSILLIISILIQPTIVKIAYSFMVFPCMHISYGLGYLIGIFSLTNKIITRSID